MPHFSKPWDWNHLLFKIQFQLTYEQQNVFCLSLMALHSRNQYQINKRTILSPILIPCNTPCSFLTSFGVTFGMETVLNWGSAFRISFLVPLSCSLEWGQCESWWVPLPALGNQKLLLSLTSSCHSPGKEAQHDCRVGKKKPWKKKKLHWFEVKSICSPKMPWDWLSLVARCGGEQSRTNLADRGTLRWFVITRLRNKGVELMEAGLETCNLKIPCDSNKFLLLAEFFMCLLILCCIHSFTCYIKLILQPEIILQGKMSPQKTLTDVKLQSVD